MTQYYNLKKKNRTVFVNCLNLKHHHNNKKKGGKSMIKKNIYTCDWKNLSVISLNIYATVTYYTMF